MIFHKSILHAQIDLFKLSIVNSILISFNPLKIQVVFYECRADLVGVAVTLIFLLLPTTCSMLLLARGR